MIAIRAENGLLQTSPSPRLVGDNRSHSSISMRRGGIIAGCAAKGPEPILFLQRRHSSNCAARNYMVLDNSPVLYDTYLAFGLEL